MPKATATPPRSSRITLPQRIPTDRLVLRPWRRTDAPLLKSVIDANLEHLRAWMPWAQKEPSALSVVEQRIDRFDRQFRAESEWAYAILSDGEKMLYGGAGLVRSTERGALELGFWLGKSWTKQGYATEAVRALTNAAMAIPGIERVQIRCDARNAASAAVARRAGYRHLTTLNNHVFEHGAPPRDTMVWEFGSSTAIPAAAPARRGFWATLKSLFGRDH